MTCRGMVHAKGVLSSGYFCATSGYFLALLEAWCDSTRVIWHHLGGGGGGGVVTRYHVM